jgi:glycosyltransferase involved in cell wall biosynthesis
MPGTALADPDLDPDLVPGLDPGLVGATTRLEPAAGRSASTVTAIDGGRSPAPDLSVVIPMRNARECIGELLRELLAVRDLSLEVIVVDDASTDGSAEVVRATAGGAVRLLRVGQRRGAGHARNLGFAHATGTYTLFFDADDEIHLAALSAAVTTVRDARADVAFLPYRYRRGHSTEYEGMNSYDRAVWSHYASRQRLPLGLGDVPRLLGFSNYPWNKVLRTDRFVERGLRFGETAVHNDILGHWITLLEARTLVLVDEPLCTHIVADGAGNLTNHRSRIRLHLFDALGETYSYLEQRPALRSRYSHHYWDFALRVASWAAERIDTDLADEFGVRLQRHLLRMNLADFSHIRQRRDPGLGTRIVRRALA